MRRSLRSRPHMTRRCFNRCRRLLARHIWSFSSAFTDWSCSRETGGITAVVGDFKERSIPPIVPGEGFSSAGTWSLLSGSGCSTPMAGGMVSLSRISSSEPVLEGGNGIVSSTGTSSLLSEPWGLIPGGAWLVVGEGTCRIVDARA